VNVCCGAKFHYDLSKMAAMISPLLHTATRRLMKRGRDGIVHYDHPKCDRWAAMSDATPPILKGDDGEGGTATLDFGAGTSLVYPWLCCLMRLRAVTREAIC